jgi:hypothetical protein
MKWKFHPAVEGGEPVPSVYHLTVRFESRPVRGRVCAVHVSEGGELDIPDCPVDNAMEQALATVDAGQSGWTDVVMAYSPPIEDNPR